MARNHGHGIRMRVRSNDIRRSKADKNKNNISKIYVHLAVVARVDL